MNATAAQAHRRNATYLRQLGVNFRGELVVGNIICSKTDSTRLRSFNYDANRPGGVYTNLNNLQAHGAGVKKAAMAQASDILITKIGPKL
jgi:hypothetical protein